MSNSAFEHQATVDKGLKMRIKRRNMSSNNKTTEEKTSSSASVSFHTRNQTEDSTTSSNQQQQQPCEQLIDQNSDASTECKVQNPRGASAGCHLLADEHHRHHHQFQGGQKKSTKTGKSKHPKENIIWNSSEEKEENHKKELTCSSNNVKTLKEDAAKSAGQRSADPPCIQKMSRYRNLKNTSATSSSCEEVTMATKEHMEKQAGSDKSGVNNNAVVAGRDEKIERNERIKDTEAADPYEFVVTKGEGSSINVPVASQTAKKKFKTADKHDVNGNGMLPATAANRSTTPSTTKSAALATSTEVMEQEGQLFTRSQQCDVATGTCDANVMTDMDMLGPCEPGTSVVLEGIVWSESNNGILVVNVTWRGKTYVGTLMDATKHHWAPPRYREDSPSTELEWKSPKYRNGRGGPASNADVSLVEGRRLRKCRRNNNSTVNSLRSQTARQSPVFNPNETPAPAACTTSGGRRRPRTAVDNQQPADADSPVPSKKAKESKTRGESESPQMWECHEGNCGKKFKHATGLRYHQTHVHKKLPLVVVNGNVVEELKESSPASCQDLVFPKKVGKKSSRTGSPGVLDSESSTPVAEMVETFEISSANPCEKLESKHLIETISKSSTPELKTETLTVASETNNDIFETARTTNKKKQSSSPSIEEPAKSTDGQTKAATSHKTSGSIEAIMSSITPHSDLRSSKDSSPVPSSLPLDNRSISVTPKSEPAKTPTLVYCEISNQEAPLNCKTSPQNMAIKSEQSTPQSYAPVKLQSGKDIKSEPETPRNPSAYEIDKTARQKKTPSPWRDRMPSLIPQASGPPLTAQPPPPQGFHPSMFPAYGIEPLYHVQLMSSNAEYRNQFDRWVAEQHFRHMYATGRFEADRQSTVDAKPVDMTLKSSAVSSHSPASSSQEQVKSQKKSDPIKKPLVSNNNNNNSNNNNSSFSNNSSNMDRKMHSSKKFPTSSTPSNSHQEEKRKSISSMPTYKQERPESRHTSASPAQSSKPLSRSHHRDSELPLFPQNSYQFSSAQSKMPYDFQPIFHGPPFLDPAAAQVGLSRPPSHFMEKSPMMPDISVKSEPGRELPKTPSGKKSIDASEDNLKDSSSKDKPTLAPSSLGGHSSPLTLRHLHTHHHTHVLGPAYSLYGSYNGLVQPVSQLVQPVVPVMPQSFIPK